jgi:hypothetical protein
MPPAFSFSRTLGVDALARRPAPGLGVDGGLVQRVLGRPVERVVGGTVDDDHVLRQPGLSVVPVLQVLVGLAVDPGRAAAHVALDDPRGHRLRQLGRLHGDRLRADQFGNARRGRTVGAPLRAAQVGGGRERLLRVDALRRPRHRVQQHHPLLAELLLEQRTLGLVQLHRLVVAVGEEGQAVGTEDLPLVLVVHEQDLAGLRLSALHRALDLRRLEQRGVGVHGDLQLAGAGLVDVGREGGQVLAVEIGRRVGGGQIPLGLRRRAERQGGERGERDGSDQRHEGHSCLRGQKGNGWSGCLAV